MECTAFYYGFDQYISERTYKESMMLFPVSQYAEKEYEDALKTVRSVHITRNRNLQFQEAHMEKLKSIIFVAGIMLLVLAAAVGYLSIKYLTAILPADSYEDKGVYTFSPYQVLPVQVQNTGASGRNRRMNPTKTVYKVYYKDAGGSGYQWSEQALTRELGQDVVDAGAAVERRVLAIDSDRSYITVEPGQTAESYTAGLRQKYIIVLVLAGSYILLYVIVWCVAGGMKRGVG